MNNITDQNIKRSTVTSTAPLVNKAVEPKQAIEDIMKANGIYNPYVNIANTINSQIREERTRYANTYGKSALEDYDNSSALFNEVTSYADFKNTKPSYYEGDSKNLDGYLKDNQFNLVTSYYMNEHTREKLGLGDNVLRGSSASTDEEDLSVRLIGYMTDDEKRVYNYLFFNGRYDDAKKYIMGLVPYLQEKAYIETEGDKLSDIAKNGNRVVGALQNIAPGLVNSINYGIHNIGQAISNTFTGEDKIVSPFGQAGIHMLANQAHNEAAKRGASPLGELLIDVGISMGQNAMLLPLMSAPGGKYVVSGILASSAGGNAMFQKMMEGASAQEAADYGVHIGAIEFLTELISVKSLEKIFEGASELASSTIKGATKATFQDTLKNLAKTTGAVAAGSLSQAGAESLEEVVSEVGGLAYDALFSLVRGNGLGKISQYYNEMKAKNQSDTEAFWNTLKKFGADVFTAALGGAISGGTMGGGAVVTGSAKANISSYLQNKSVKAPSAQKITPNISAEQGVVAQAPAKKPLINDLKSQSQSAAQNEVVDNGQATEIPTETPAQPEVNVQAEEKGEVSAPTTETKTPDTTKPSDKQTVLSDEKAVLDRAEKVYIATEKAVKAISGNKSGQSILDQFKDVVERTKTKRNSNNIKATHNQIDKLVERINSKVARNTEKISSFKLALKGATDSTAATITSNIKKLQAENRNLKKLATSAIEIKENTLQPLTDEEQRTLDSGIEEYGAQREDIPKRQQLPNQLTDDTLTRQSAQSRMASPDVSDTTKTMIQRATAQGRFEYKQRDFESVENDAAEVIESLGKDGILKLAKEAAEGTRGVSDAEAFAIFATTNSPEAAGLTTDELNDLIDYNIAIASNASGIMNASRASLSLGLTDGTAGAGAYIKVLKRQLKEVQKEIERRKLKIKADTLKLNPQLIEKLTKATTPQEKIDLVEQIKDDLASQIGSTDLEKINAFRYIAMLGNPRTAAKNLLGNASMFGASEISNLIKTAIEKIAGKLQNNKGKGFLVEGYEKSGEILKKSDKSLVDWGRTDFDTVGKQMVKGSRYDSESNDILRRRQTYDNKVMQGIQAGVRAMNDLPDQMFIKNNYARAMARWLKANGITAEQLNNPEQAEALKGQLIRAREVAVQEALHQSLREGNAALEFINKKNSLNHPLARAFAEGVVQSQLPFARTTTNSLLNMMRYSPLGFVNVATDLITNKKNNGAFQLSENGVTALSRAITGTSIFALGTLLQQFGLLRATDDDKDEDKYNSLLGYQNYSLVIPWFDGNEYTYSLDWLSPVVVPLMAGVEAGEMLDEENISYEDFLSGLWRMGGPITEMSLLKGVNDTMKTITDSQKSGAAENEWIGDALTAFALSYFSQFIPSAIANVTQSVDTRRDTYHVNNKDLAVFERWANKQMAKIPIASGMLPEYSDKYGRQENSTPGEKLASVLGAFLGSPGYTEKIKEDEVSAMVKDIYKNIQGTENAKRVLPVYFDKNVEVAKGNDVSGNLTYEKINPTKEQYEKMSRVFGQTQHSLSKKAGESEYFKERSYQEQADILSDLYSYAKSKAVIEAFPDEFAKDKGELGSLRISSEHRKMYELEKLGINLADFLACKAEIKARNAKIATKRAIVSEYFDGAQRRAVYIALNID